MKAALLLGALLSVAAHSQTAASKTALLTPAFNSPRELKELPGNGDLKSIRVVTWNIDRGEELDKIVAELHQNQAELCLLQEVDWNTARAGRKDVASELARRLHLNLSYGIEFEELSQEREGQAFIGQATLTSLPIRESRILRFQRQSGWWKPRGWIPSSIPFLQRRLGNRIALVTELQFADHLLVVYNAHLESRSVGRIQAAQLDEMLADLRRYPADTPIILAGDLNTKYLPSFFLHKLERQGFHSATGQRIERTHTIMMSLDWIFARGPVTINEGTVRRDLKGSDHYPVYAQLKAR